DSELAPASDEEPQLHPPPGDEVTLEIPAIGGPPDDQNLSRRPPPPPKRPRSAPPSERAVAQALQAPKFEPPTAKPRARPWWEELFTDDFGRGILPPTTSQVRREVDFIEDSLAVAKGGAVLDLACGN